MKHLFKLSVISMLFLLASEKGFAQSAPIYNFSSPELVSGTANTTGATYRFPNAYTGVDALVLISSMTAGISLQNIDRTADGYSEAFQPEYKVSANTNGYIDFTITFVLTGTSIPVSQPIVSASGLDIDGSTKSGNTLKEFNQIDMGGGMYEFNSYNTQLVISQTGTAYKAANTTGILFGALVDTAAKEVMFTVTATNLSSMNYRVGANNQTTSTSTRYASLYYKKFTYQHYPLAISSLLSFKAVAKNQEVSLQWDITENQYSQLVLERSYNPSVGFEMLSSYSMEAGGNKSQTYHYTDYQVSGPVVYYRLKSTTKSGQVAYSSTLSVAIDQSRDLFKVYPSIIQDYATISFTGTETTNAIVFVCDLAGRVVKQQQVVLNQELTNMKINGFDRLLKGTYIVSLRTATNVYTKKVIVQ